jgi:hypothetical protein
MLSSMTSFASGYARVRGAFGALDAWRGAVLEMGVENALAKDEEMHLEYPARRMEAVNAWNEAYEALDEFSAAQEAVMTVGASAAAGEEVAAGLERTRQLASAAVAAAERALRALRAARRAKAAAGAPAGGGAGSGSATRAGAAALAGGAPPEDEEENADEKEEADDEDEEDGADDEEDLGENKTEPFLTLDKIEESLGTSIARVMEAFHFMSCWARWETSAAGQEVLVGALEEQGEAFARRKEFLAAHDKAKLDLEEAFHVAFAADNEGATSAKIAQAQAASKEVARLAGATAAAAGRVVAAARAAAAAGRGAAAPALSTTAAGGGRPFSLGPAAPPAPGVFVFGSDRSAPPPGREEEGSAGAAPPPGREETGGAGAVMGMWEQLGPICKSHHKDTARSAEEKERLDARARLFEGLLYSRCIVSDDGTVATVFKMLHEATEAHAELEGAVAKARAAFEAALESPDQAAASAGLREAKVASEERTRLADAYAAAAGRAVAAMAPLQLAGPALEDLGLASHLEDLELPDLASQLEGLDLARPAAEHPEGPGGAAAAAFALVAAAAPRLGADARRRARRSATRNARRRRAAAAAAVRAGRGAGAPAGPGAVGNGGGEDGGGGNGGGGNGGSEDSGGGNGGGEDGGNGGGES